MTIPYGHRFGDDPSLPSAPPASEGSSALRGNWTAYAKAHAGPPQTLTETRQCEWAVKNNADGKSQPFDEYPSDTDWTLAQFFCHGDKSIEGCPRRTTRAPAKDFDTVGRNPRYPFVRLNWCKDCQSFSRVRTHSQPRPNRARVTRESVLTSVTTDEIGERLADLARVRALTKARDVTRKLASLRESLDLFDEDDTLSQGIRARIDALTAERPSSSVAALHEIVASIVEIATASLTAQGLEGTDTARVAETSD